VTTTQIKNNRVGVTAAPTAVSATDNAVIAGSLAAISYFWKITATGPFGESIASAEFTLLATVNHSANILFTPPAAATGYRLYRGTVTATENVLVMTGGCTGGVAATVVDIGSAGVAATPPASSALTTVTKAVTIPAKSNLPAVDLAHLIGTAGGNQFLYAGLAEWLSDAASATSVPINTSAALRGAKMAAAAGFLLQET